MKKCLRDEWMLAYLGDGNIAYLDMIIRAALD